MGVHKVGHVYYYVPHQPEQALALILAQLGFEGSKKNLTFFPSGRRLNLLDFAIMMGCYLR